MTKELKDSNYLEDEFKSWAKDEFKSDGERYSEVTINGYISSLKSTSKRMESLETEYKINLFYIDCLDKFIKVERKIRENENFNTTNERTGGNFSAGISLYYKFLESKAIEVPIKPKVDFDINSFKDSLNESGLIYNKQIIVRFVASLCTKPFVILTGLSGSGKTQLALSFVRWLCTEKNTKEAIKQYEIVPVGSEWTNIEPLLGFPNALQSDKYESPDNGVLDLLINANNNPEKPFFLILDEMNLSHVERYFSDFLSVMESDEKIPLYNSTDDRGRIPSSIKLPNNLFIIGTVNIDETTYMFSPKVLDRANTIEFRINPNDMEYFLNNDKELDINNLRSKGVSMSDSFLDITRDRSFKREKLTKYNDILLKFFIELSKVGSEFGYRSVSEIHLLIDQLLVIDPDINDDEILDIALMQKILPKLHGSRRKILPILKVLADLCVITGKVNIEKDILSKDFFNFKDISVVKYSLSLEKIIRMYNNAIELGYTSYSEA